MIVFVVNYDNIFISVIFLCIFCVDDRFLGVGREVLDISEKVFYFEVRIVGQVVVQDLLFVNECCVLFQELFDFVGEGMWCDGWVLELVLDVK